VVLSNDELNLLSTALAALVNNRELCTIKRGGEQYSILCADAQRRNFSQDQIVGVLERLAGVAQGSLSTQAKETLKGAGL
jgi:hypothetical protein